LEGNRIDYEDEYDDEDDLTGVAPHRLKPGLQAGRLQRKRLDTDARKAHMCFRDSLRRLLQFSVNGS